MAKITLIGLLNYDPDLFENLTVPEGIDRDTLLDNIILRCADFEVMYPDNEFLKFSIGAWARKWMPTFQRWVDALSIEYDPLENYDRNESWSDSGWTSGSNSGSSSSQTSGSTSTTMTDKVSAYDAGDALTTKDQTETYGTDSSSSSGSNSLTSSESRGDTRTGRIHGNIGVTTSQQMLQSELDLGYWNIYEKITDLFLTEFVIPVY